jgi:hypothetical protein
MHEVRRLILGAFTLGFMVPACHRNAPDGDARAQLIAVLGDSLGERANPDVSFMQNGGRPESHLYVTFGTSATPNVSDSDFDLRARDLAGFVVRHYAHASELDSISVAAREPMRLGLWRVHHRRAFASADVAASQAR